MSVMTYYTEELERIAQKGNLRCMPRIMHEGKLVEADGRQMLNLSSNDYLGLASDGVFREEFLQSLSSQQLDMSAASSRLLTGNFSIIEQVEDLLAHLFGTEAALVFNSGYHMNTGILPALADEQTLVLADKLVHASLIDGIRLSSARCIRFRHQDYGQLESLLEKYTGDYNRVMLVVESVYSMDGDLADLPRLVALKKRYENVMLYVDEAHGIGVFGPNGLGVAEAQGCIQDIDLLCGTFGKAVASVGAYVVCNPVLRDFLVNRMRTLIFTTALPPINWLWTNFVLQRLPDLKERRVHLQLLSAHFRRLLENKGYGSASGSPIVPLVVGESVAAVVLAEQLQQHGFYVLPVRPPTVPEGTARLRFSLTASLTEEEIDRLSDCIPIRK